MNHTFIQAEELTMNKPTIMKKLNSLQTIFKNHMDTMLENKFWKKDGPHRIEK